MISLAFLTALLYAARAAKLGYEAEPSNQRKMGTY